MRLHVTLRAVRPMLASITPMGRGNGVASRRRAMRAALSVLPVLAYPGLAPSRAGITCHEDSRVAMACPWTVRACGPDAAALPRIGGDALGEVDRIDRLMSHYRQDSPLSRLNREAAHTPVAVDPELFDFIAECLRWSRDSDGAFDITVGTLMKAWGFFGGEGRVPAPSELAEARRGVGYAHVLLDPAARTIRFDRPGVELDLGGIAKGYAVDRIVRLLRGRGIRSALVNAGGSSVYGLGAPPGGEAWEVGVEDPIQPGRIAVTVRLRDRALSVSGGSERSFQENGVTYTHVMDPRTGWPVESMLSVAVLAETATAGDALDDAFFVLGEKATRAYLSRLPSTEALLFLPRQGRKWRLVRLTS